MLKAATVQMKLHGKQVAFDSQAKRCFESARSIAEEVLKRCEVRGEFLLTPREKVKWKAKNGEKICLRPSNGRDIRVRIRPGNNDTCWEYSLISPAGTEVDALRVILEQNLGPEETDASHEKREDTALTADLQEVQDAIILAMSKRNARRLAIQTGLAKHQELGAEMSMLMNHLEKLTEQAEKMSTELIAMAQQIDKLKEDDRSDKEADSAEQLAKELGLNLE